MKISIITCTYNSEKYIKKNIESVKNQTFKNFEHVFIDGFSSDKTLEIIKKYQKEFPKKVKLYQFKPNGIAHAMNKGIEKSSGKYIIHLHSDDSFFDNKVLTETNNFLRKKNYPDWIYGKINVVEKNDTNVGIFPKYKILQLGKVFFSSYLLKFINFIPHQAVFIKKEILEKFNGFDTSITSKMDTDLWIKIREITQWVFFDRIISNFKISPDAQSSGEKNQNENNKNLEKVQRRYMNNLEFFFSCAINKILEKINKTTR
jgi:glycosyltransferase involved in cell wall biosynthesis